MYLIKYDVIFSTIVIFLRFNTQSYTLQEKPKLAKLNYRSLKYNSNSISVFE